MFEFYPQRPIIGVLDLFCSAEDQMGEVSFTYNSRQYLGQTVFIKRGEHQGKMGQVKRELGNDKFVVALGDEENERVTFHRSDFLIYRHRKIRIPANRV